jgi:hypothetical protein
MIFPLIEVPVRVLSPVTVRGPVLPPVMARAVPP